MRTGLLAVLSAMVLAGATATAADSPAACRSTVSGDLRLHTLESRTFGNTRTIRVLLPPGYEAPANAARRYPVLYLLDGQNLFDACLSDVSHQEWGVDETVYHLIAAQKIPPLIVVGVDHAGRDRAHEYLPYKDFVGGSVMPEPAGQRFPQFLVHEVMPLVDGRYRTLPGQPNTGIGGSSYGGVAALYALLACDAREGVPRVRRPGGRQPRGQRQDGGARAPGRGEFPRRRLRRLEHPHGRGSAGAAHRDRLGRAPARGARVPVRRLAVPGALEFLFGGWRKTPSPTR